MTRVPKSVLVAVTLAVAGLFLLMPTAEARVEIEWSSNHLPVPTPVTAATFIGTRFMNEHIALDISPYSATIASIGDSQPLADAAYFVIERDSPLGWTRLPWSDPPRLTQADSGGLHRVLVRGVADGSVAVEIAYEARAYDVPSIGLVTYVEISPLQGAGVYRIAMRLDGVRSDVFNLEHREGGSPVAVRRTIDGSSGALRVYGDENALVAFDPSRASTRFGLNWERAGPVYQGIAIDSGPAGSSIQVRFGDFPLAAGERYRLLGPIPDGGGGGGGGSSTSVMGYVRVKGSLTGVYGAKVSFGGYSGWTSTTGSYYITLPGGTYTVNIIAHGFGFTPQTVTVTSGQTNWKNFEVWVPSTYQYRRFWELKDLSGVKANGAVLYSRNVNNPRISVGPLSDWDPSYPAPSGATDVISIGGWDASPSGTGYAYAYFYLTPVYLPLSGPTFLSFNLYVYSSGSGKGQISIDAHFTDGSVLRDVQNSLGAYIKEGDGLRVHPAHQRAEAKTWQRIVVDLTELRFRTIDYLMVGYDNGGLGGGGGCDWCDSSFGALFDDIRLEMPILSANVINGGFELGDLYGWSTLGSPGPRIRTFPYRGYHALVGRDPAVYGYTSVAEDVQLLQAFRLHNDPNYSPKLRIFAKFGTTDPCLCTTNNWLKVSINDRTTQWTTDYLTVSRNTPSGTYEIMDFDLSAHKGHIVWLVISAHHVAGSYYSWGYFEEIRVHIPEIRAYEGGNPSGSTLEGWVGLNPNVYQQGTQTVDLPLSFLSAGKDAATRSGVAAGIDLRQYHRNYWNPAKLKYEDSLTFSSSILAWPGPGYIIRKMTLTITLWEVPGYSNAGLRLDKGSVLCNGLAALDCGRLGPVPDAFEMTLTIIDGALLVAGFVPEIAVFMGLASVVVFVVGLVYDMTKGGSPPSGDTRSVSESWDDCNGWCPTIGSGKIGDGTIGFGAGLGSTSGTEVLFYMTASADVYTTTGGFVKTISSTLYLDFRTTSTWNQIP